MPRKQRKIDYEIVTNKRTGVRYMKFKNLSEFPRLEDIKYLITSTLEHFKREKNWARYNELVVFLYQTIHK